MNLSGCNKISTLASLSLTLLEKLDLSFSNINDEGLMNLVGEAAQLKMLNLSYCENISDLPALALSSLEELDIGGCTLTIQDLIRLLKNTPQLKKLSLLSCPQFEKNKLPPSLRERLDKIFTVSYPEPTLRYTSNYPQPEIPPYSEQKFQENSTAEAVNSKKNLSQLNSKNSVKDEIEKLGHPSRIILNEAHAFCEVFVEKQWITCDLGGYAAHLDIDDSSRPSNAGLEEDNLPLEETLPENTFEEEWQDNNFEEDATKNNDSLLVPLLPEQGLVKDYSSLFATWEKKQAKPLALKRYYQQLLHSLDIKNRLIELSSDEALRGLKAGLYKFCHLSTELPRPVFFIQSPDDLICSAPFMQVLPDGRSGKLVKGPGGPLYEFLQLSTPENPPLIIVDYSKFDASDMVRFNSLLDTQRKADGSDVPQEITIIGVINNGVANPQGSDFYSRFDKHEHCPFTDAELQQALPPSLFQAAPEALEDATYINLFHASDWKERLLGRWVLQGQTLTWEEGRLAAALATPDKPIVIENGLNDNPEFKKFWELAALTHHIPHPIEPLLLFKEGKEKPIRFYEKEGYDWSALIGEVKVDNSFHPEGITLNPSTLTHLFKRYKAKDKALQTLDGLFAKHATTKPLEPLHLNLTRELSEDQWAECLAEAQQLGLSLSIHAPNDLALPQPLKELATVNPSAKPLSLNKDSLLLSSDSDASIAGLNLPDAYVLDISECDASDLLRRLSGKFDSDALRFEFDQSDKALKQAFKQDKTVILKGQFSPELADSLVKLLLKRQFAKEPAQGNLIIVTEDAGAFPQELLQTQKVSSEEKQRLLRLNDEQLKQAGLEDRLETASFAELKTRLAYHRRHPGKDSDKAWEGMHHLAVPLLSPFIPEQSRQEADAFKIARLKAVQDVLTTEPYVFLTGLTGVGKSTFVAEEFKSSQHYYHGESQIKAWANDDSQSIKILFLDEANLSKR